MTDAARRLAEQMQREQELTESMGLLDVFFSFDSWQLSEQAKQALREDATWLKAERSQRVIVEGHCDERGTGAYNLVLGEKRAKVIRKYVIELGVEPHRVAITSYGKERPFCRQRTEASHQTNRRGHLVLQVESVPASAQGERPRASKDLGERERKGELPLTRRISQ